MKLDLIIKNANIFNVYSKKFLRGDIGVKDGVFSYVYDDLKGIEATETIDLEGKHLIPGLIDIHMHIESSMTTPFQFAQGTIKSGTTTIVSDPHEIANVCGVKGIEEMISLSENELVDIYFGIPSSVPATTIKLETTGAEIKPTDVKELLTNPRVICLGEVMNLKELLGNNSTKTNRIINEVTSFSRHLKIEGHCPKVTGLDLSTYIARGVDADHTQQTPALLEEKIKKGMFIELQGKSIIPENIKYLVENELYEHFSLVTDDMMADHLLHGHLNLLLLKAVALGLPMEMAIYTSTYTAARRMNLYDRGSIAPGKIADFIILDDLNNFEINSVYKNGLKYSNLKGDYQKDPQLFPKQFYNSVNLMPLTENDFKVVVNSDKSSVMCRAIDISEHTTFTNEKHLDMKICNEELNFWDSEARLITVFDRYTGSGRGVGLITGATLKRGAFATTYAHDHHNLTVVGSNKRDMTIAANWVIENQGGICVVHEGEILASLELPIAGILSDETLNVLGYKLATIKERLKNLGYRHDNVIMSMSTASLPVSPMLKITDKGLIDVLKQEIVSLVIEE